jgi:MoxR-like ATPase
LKPPFFVLATQNPLEMEGTYPLPEAQVDRFLLKLVVEFPPLEDLIEVSRRTTRRQTNHAQPVLDSDQVVRLAGTVRDVPIAAHVEKYAARLLLATHPNTAQTTPMTKQFVKYGASPRGLQAMVLGGKVRALLDGRYNVSVDDIKQVAKPALRHRIILNFEGEAEEVKTDLIVQEILDQAAVEAN